MKKVITFALCVILAACAKKTNPVTPSPNPSNPQNPNNPTSTTARFIPNWQRDTLIGTGSDINGQLLYDTIITYSINDTSFIDHQGKRHYIWWKPAFATDTFEQNADIYGNCAISTTKDTTGIINKYNVAVFPYRYWDDFYNAWSYQKQALTGHIFSTTVKVSGPVYISIKSK